MRDISDAPLREPGHEDTEACCFTRRRGQVPENAETDLGGEISAPQPQTIWDCGWIRRVSVCVEFDPERRFPACSGCCPRLRVKHQVQIPRRQRMTIPRLASLARNLRSLGMTEAVPHFPLPDSPIPSFPHFGVLSGDPTHERGSSVGWFVGGVSTSRRLGRTGLAAEDGTPA